jgi:methylaspartate ammonia-lyase
MFFDVLDEKVAKVLHRTDVVAQVVADNHVRLRDDAMVFVDAEALEVGVQFPPLLARDVLAVVEVEATRTQQLVLGP